MNACMTPSIVTKVVVMIFRISDSLVNKGVAAFVSMSSTKCGPASLQLVVDRRRSKSTEPGRRREVRNQSGGGVDLLGSHARLSG